MARPRTPRAKAAVQASDKKNPQRFTGRNEPKIDAPIGDPPSWLVDNDLSKARTAWVTFVTEIPWLNGTHRSFLEIASNIRGRLMTGQEVGVQALNLLRQCLGQMGATPADSTKVTLPNDDEEDGDDLDD